MLSVTIRAPRIVFKTYRDKTMFGLRIREGLDSDQRLLDSGPEHIAHIERGCS